MTDDGAPLARLLARLPAASPDPARTASVQALCHGRIARRLRRPAVRPVRRFEPLVIVGLCLAYLFGVIQQALH